MHILHLVPYYAPAYAFGGVVSAVVGLASAQAGLGHRVTVVTTDARDHTSRFHTRRDQIDGVEVIRVRNLSHILRARLNLSTPLGIGRVVRQLQPDIIHTHELRTVENLLSLRPRAPAPTILSPHGTITHSTGRGLLKRGWDIVFGTAIMKQINAVLALTEDEAEDVRNLWPELKMPVPPISVLPNGVRLDMPPTGDLRARYGISAGEDVVLFLGRLHERKGVQLLIPAFAQAANGSNARLLIVGPDEGMLAQLSQLAREHGIMDRVIFTGLLTGADRDAALRTANLFALPAVGEGLPMSALEAMAAGLPILVTPGCHLPEVEQRGAGVLVERDISAIAAGLAQLLNMPEAARAELAEHAQAWVREQYDWRTIAGRTLDIYRQVIG